VPEGTTMPAKSSLHELVIGGHRDANHSPNKTTVLAKKTRTRPGLIFFCVCKSLKARKANCCTDSCNPKQSTPLHQNPGYSVNDGRLP